MPQKFKIPAKNRFSWLRREQPFLRAVGIQLPRQRPEVDHTPPVFLLNRIDGFALRVRGERIAPHSGHIGERPAADSRSVILECRAAQPFQQRMGGLRKTDARSAFPDRSAGGEHGFRRLLSTRPGGAGW